MRSSLEERSSALTMSCKDAKGRKDYGLKNEQRKVELRSHKPLKCKARMLEMIIESLSRDAETNGVANFKAYEKLKISKSGVKMVPIVEKSPECSSYRDSQLNSRGNFLLNDVQFSSLRQYTVQLRKWRGRHYCLLLLQILPGMSTNNQLNRHVTKSSDFLKTFRLSESDIQKQHLRKLNRMEGSSMRDQVAMRKNLLDQGYVDDQFVQLEQLGGDDCPDFAQEVISMYFEDSDRFIQNIERCLEVVPINFVDLDKVLHQLKGSSASVGANRVRIEVNRMRDLCKEKNAESCKEVLQNLKRERAELKGKMDHYFQLPRNAASSSAATCSHGVARE